jgi:tetratricopeptide (TPR) repeat protein
LFNAAAIAVAAVVLTALGALSYLRAEVWSSETSFWEDATQKSPRNTHAVIQYGAALSAEGLTDQGYSQLVHAAQLSGESGKNAPDELDLARAFDLLNKDKEAETHFRRALDSDPNYGPAWSGYSQWLMIRQRASEAYKAALRAMQISPWNTEAQHTLLQYYSAASDWTNLKKTAETVLRVDPTDADGRRSLAVAQMAFDAVKTAEEKAKSDPSADDFLALSVKYYQMRRFEDSIGACRDALKVRPELGEAYSNMAAAYYALGKTDEAIKALREAIRVRPDLTVAKQNLDFLLSIRAEGSKPSPAATTP